jgi:hypothetical protein
MKPTCSQWATRRGGRRKLPVWVAFAVVGVMLSGYEIQHMASGAPRFAPQVARDGIWDAQFASLGTNEPVNAIAVSGSDVYVGGRFTTVGKMDASGIAKWDGSHWSALGSGVDGVVFAIAVSGNNVYAGGYFTYAGGERASCIAKWDGTLW